MSLYEIENIKKSGICIFVKNDSKRIYNVTKDFYLQSMLFFWTFYSSKNPKNVSHLHKNIEQHNYI